MFSDVLQKDCYGYMAKENPDIMCLQETKCSETKLPVEANVKGYHSSWLSGKYAYRKWVVCKIRKYFV